MSLKLFAITFASLAAAEQLTTTMWFPAHEGTNSFVGSVVAKNGDRTTVSLEYPKQTSEDDYFASAPATVTLGGTTYFGFQQSYGEKDTPMTIDVGCSRKDERDTATCQMSTVGYSSILSSYCNSVTGNAGSVTTYTRTRSDRTEIKTATIPSIEDSELPEMCTATGAAANGVSTLTMDGESASLFNTFQLVITAGAEKLTAAATPTGGAKQTGSAGQSAGQSAAATGQSTGAAPMMTAAPMLAGLGAAAAAIFL